MAKTGEASQAKLVGEQTEMGLKLVETVDINSIRLGKAQMIDLWELGILPPLAYIHFALQYEKRQREMEGKDDPSTSLNVDRFIENWQGVLNPNTGKMKLLSRKQVLGALCVLEEKEVFEIPKAVLQLSFEI